MNLPALFGLLCTGVLIVCAMGFSGHSIHVFVDSSALLIVPIGTLCLLGATHRFSTTFRVLFGGWRRILAPGRSVDWSADQRLEAVTVATTGRMLSLLMGLFGGILGLIGMLQVLDDPTRIGSSMAVCLLALFYALVQNLLIFFPLARYFGGASAIDGAP